MVRRLGVRSRTETLLTRLRQVLVCWSLAVGRARRYGAHDHVPDALTNRDDEVAQLVNVIMLEIILLPGPSAWGAYQTSDQGHLADPSPHFKKDHSPFEWPNLWTSTSILIIRESNG